MGGNECVSIRWPEAREWERKVAVILSFFATHVLCVCVFFLFYIFILFILFLSILPVNGHNCFLFVPLSFLLFICVILRFHVSNKIVCLGLHFFARSSFLVSSVRFRTVSSFFL